MSFQRQEVMSVLNDKAAVEKLQSNHGGFDKEHEEVNFETFFPLLQFHLIHQFVGKLGHIINIDEDGDVLLKMGTLKVVWNRRCLRKSDFNLQEQLLKQTISSEEEGTVYIYSTNHK